MTVSVFEVCYSCNIWVFCKEWFYTCSMTISNSNLTLNLLNFLNGLVCISCFWTVHYYFKGYQDESLKLVLQQYRGRPDCMDMQARPDFQTSLLDVYPGSILLAGHLQIISSWYPNYFILISPKINNGQKWNNKI